MYKMCIGVYAIHPYIYVMYVYGFVYTYAYDCVMYIWFLNFRIGKLTVTT